MSILNRIFSFNRYYLVIFFTLCTVIYAAWLKIENYKLELHQVNQQLASVTQELTRVLNEQEVLTVLDDRLIKEKKTEDEKTEKNVQNIKKFRSENDICSDTPVPAPVVMLMQSR